MLFQLCVARHIILVSFYDASSPTSRGLGHNSKYARDNHLYLMVHPIQRGPGLGRGPSYARNTPKIREPFQSVQLVLALINFIFAIFALYFTYFLYTMLFIATVLSIPDTADLFS